VACVKFKILVHSWLSIVVGQAVNCTSARSAKCKYLDSFQVANL